MEAAEIALYMVLVCSFATLLLHPISPVQHFIPVPICFCGLAGGLAPIVQSCITIMTSAASSTTDIAQRASRFSFPRRRHESE